ncbi:LytR C-terminal domain-containing protein [Nocardioides sp. YIM 152588]|uniref:LytR C-terminal domain-containing protein n=1 Tax=Nocardioides sp. YIM 152588 TaxID=3158259 RepID=UPI0032E5122D
MNVSATARSGATMAVLAALFLGGIAWAWGEVTAPFPVKEDPPACVDTPVSSGERVRPGDVVVSVLNASRRTGLAGQTIDQLMDFGFSGGESGNATVAGASNVTAQIWTTDPRSPAVRLVRTYLGDGVRIVEQPSDRPGVTVVVGQQFTGVTKGRKSVKAGKDTSVCAPTGSATP